jgi:hypothetical protein
MARGPRLEAPESLRHPIVRGIKRRCFLKIEKEGFLDQLETVVTEDKASCLAWGVNP